MQLDSVRELKASLIRSMLEPMAAIVGMRRLSKRAVPLAAQPIEGLDGPHRTLGLGIVRTRDCGYRLAVRVQRRSMEVGPELEAIRRKAHGEVDERYIGRVVKQAVPWHQKRNRPLRIGSSIGHFKVTAGTLGCFVRRHADGVPMILSNNHVLADENKAKIGDPIVQPGAYDGGRRPADIVAKLEDFVRVQRRAINFVDCAVGAVHEGIKFDPLKLDGLGKISGLSDVELDEGAKVAKVGRTTGTTHGLVTAFELDNLMVGFDVGDVRFDNQIEIEGVGHGPFSDGGDSGSLIVDDQLRGAALLFAGSDQGGSNGKGLTYANPLGSVLDKLKVELLY